MYIYIFTIFYYSLQAEVIIHCGYGSSKDISVYSSVGLRSDQIYVVGKASKKQHLAAKVLFLSNTNIEQVLYIFLLLSYVV